MSKLLKLITVLLISFFSLNFAFANIIDDSITRELNQEKIKELQVNFNLKSFKSCEDMETVMEKYIRDYWKANKKRYIWSPRIWHKWMPQIDIMQESVIEIESISVKSYASDRDWNFSKTNIQVDWVDEADIIKTDWDYIFYFNNRWDFNENKYIYIIDSKNPKNLKIVKKIRVPGFLRNTKLYVSKNRLTILASGYSQNKYKRNWINKNAKTYVIVYDTSSKEKPILKKLYITDWNLDKSRKIGKYLYIISNNHFNIPFATFKSENDINLNINNIIPNKIDISKTSDKSKQNLKINWKNLPFNIKSGNIAKCNEISYALPGLETLKKIDFNPSYNIISVIDIENTENEVKIKVIAWNSSEIYMSLDNLYLTSRIYTSYNYKCPAWNNCIMPFYYGWSTNTLIHKLNIYGNTIKYQTSNIIPGSPLNQYSMDEKDSKFRIITSTNRWNSKWNQSHTDLYILDKNLKKYSSLNKLWLWEHFQSSRFMWDKLFLVTFEQIDPFFVIDLTDQKNPKVIWELKIPGYSRYLHPYDENHIIGLGYDVFQNKWWGIQNWGLKIDLYKINYDKKVTNVSINCADFSFNLCPWECIKNSCASACPPEAEICILKCAQKCENPEVKKLWDKDYIEVELLHSKILWDSRSFTEAMNNPRMFVWNRDKKLLLLPASIYTKQAKDSHRITDFFQGLIALNIDKYLGITEKYRITHIDSTWMKQQRKKECQKHIDKKNEASKCKTLIDGSTYCPPKRNYHIPDYCFAESSIWSYIASKSWKLKDSFISRALWIWDTSFAISNNKITSHNLESWKKIWEVLY